MFTLRNLDEGWILELFNPYSLSHFLDIRNYYIQYLTVNLDGSIRNLLNYQRILVVY
jgi:hypothetical protein